MFCFALFGSLDKFTEDPRLSNIDILSFKHLEVNCASTDYCAHQGAWHAGIYIFLFVLNINVT